MKEKLLLTLVAVLLLGLYVRPTLPGLAQTTDSKPAGSITPNFTTTGAANPTCADNYTTWNSSTTRNNSAQWDVSFMPGIVSASMGTPLLQDVNGDGLSDFLFFNKNISGSQTPAAYGEASCVYLNNGHGWDRAYRCVAVPGTGSSVTYYGDCAA